MSEAVRRASRRARRGVVAGMLGVCLPPSALAEAPPSWLAWNAPVECQNTSEVERRLESLLGHGVDFATVPATQVRMGWSPDRGWGVRVTVQLAEGPRDRALDAPSCADAFDVVALSLALILDPSFNPAAGEVGDAPPAAATDAAGTEPVLVAELEPPLSSAPDTSQLLTDSSAPVEANEANEAGELGPLPRKLTFGLGPLTDLGIFPVPQFGGGAQLGLSVGNVRAELEGDLLASESTRFDGAQYPVSFYSFFAALRGCYRLEFSSRFGWVGCVGSELGSLGTSERGGEQHRAQGLWLAAEAATGPEFAATSWLRAFARVRAVTPMIRHEFLLSEGSRVHALPWFSPQLQVGVSMDLTDFVPRKH